VAAGITTLEAANGYLEEVYRPAFNAEFQQPALEEGSAFVPWIGGALDDILCEQYERTVGHDNGVRFEGVTLQIPADRHRCQTSRLRCGYAVTQTPAWRSFTAHASWPITMLRAGLNRTLSRPSRNSAAIGRLGEVATGFAPPSPPTLKSGQSMCYKTGQFYLLTTGG